MEAEETACSHHQSNELLNTLHQKSFEQVFKVFYGLGFVIMKVEKVSFLLSKFFPLQNLVSVKSPLLIFALPLGSFALPLRRRELYFEVLSTEDESYHDNGAYYSPGSGIYSIYYNISSYRQVAPCSCGILQ